MKDKEKKIRYIILALILILIALFIMLLLNGSETRTSEDVEKDDISALYCEAGRIEDGFFVSETANTTSNEIKITFKNSKMDKLFYSFKGVYRSEDTASADETLLHSKYNKYMGENGVEQGSLNPSYSVVKSKFYLTLYADDYGKINETTRVFFFVDKEDLSKFNSYSLDTLKSYYEKKNFRCDVFNNDIIKEKEEVDEEN